MAEVVTSMFRFQTLNLLEAAVSNYETWHLQKILEAISRNSNDFVTVEELRKTFGRRRAHPRGPLTAGAWLRHGQERHHRVHEVHRNDHGQELHRGRLGLEGFQVFNQDGSGTSFRLPDAYLPFVEADAERAEADSRARNRDLLVLRFYRRVAESVELLSAGARGLRRRCFGR